MKRFNLINWFNGAAEKLMLAIPDRITGSSETLEKKYRMKFGDRDCRVMIRQSKLRIMSVYMCIAFFFFVAALYSVTSQLSERKELSALQRPAFGASSESIPIEVQMKYKDISMTKTFTVKVKQKELSEQDERELIRSFLDRLNVIMLGDNRDSDHISKPMNLVDRDPDTGITIKWTSSNPERISEKGKVDLIGAKKGESVELQADLILDDITAVETYSLKLDTAAEDDAYIASMINRLKKGLEKNNDAGTSVMVLPEALDGGIEVRWFSGSRGSMKIWIPFFITSVIVVYLRRYEQINREIKAAEESIVRDLPEFINKLILLLNAGLVVSSAISKIVKDYEPATSTENYGKHTKRFLYEELAEIQKRMNRSNTSLIKELTDFSKRSGVKEMVRLTTVISDNWKKGSILAEKLEEESELLWISRKKQAEEKGRIAETKLTLPLMILLIVLIMVTIAPAMMEM